MILLINEIYTAQRVEYQSRKLSAFEESATLCASYNRVSVQQVLEAEKSIRVRSLVNFSHMNIYKEISDTGESAEEKSIYVGARVEERRSSLKDQQLL